MKRVAILGVLLLTSAGSAFGQDPKPAEVIPHAQSRPPGPALSPEDAVKRMTVPEGFTVEVVASEPDLVNPVAMTFDERGRVWVTESLEYPRWSPGKGRDRVKVLEDTNGDGKADRFHVFADGLNIPSGIAVGHGGVWVANAPDLLFLQDTDGDGKADRSEVVVTGFGRSDTHELPNTLAWGPDGWLYGWNGVFNPSRIVHRGKTYEFTCAIFRVHPKTRDFEVFCEGTSNPWGIAWNEDGAAFASACVIDHLWHLTETGYYHRQGGPYRRFTWKIDSIVDHKHQQAAYCGIHYYDSDAYPPEYRGKLFMGNIHGNSVNFDRLTRNGSTYRGHPQADFLAAHDAWFMPVAQKTGPDGSLYVLDWYDRYHCYQDANRDPGGIDRLRGRLYRVRYKDTPRRNGFDLGAEPVARLVERLGSPNGYDRETARRLLVEKGGSASQPLLTKLVTDSATPRRTRMNALWTLVSQGPLPIDTHLALLADADPGIRAWAVRAAGNAHQIDRRVRDRVVELARDPSPDVQLQVAVAARKIEGMDATALLTRVAGACGDDPLIPHIVWQNLLPLLDDRSTRFLMSLDRQERPLSPALCAILPRVLERVIATPQPIAETIGTVLSMTLESGETEATRAALDRLAARVADLRGSTAGKILQTSIRPSVEVSLRLRNRPFNDDLRLLALAWRGPEGLADALNILQDPSRPEDLRLKALDGLRKTEREPDALAYLGKTLTTGPSSAFRGRLISALGMYESPNVGTLLLDLYPKLDASLRPRVVELLTQRGAWSRLLLDAVAQGTITADAVNLNQVRRLLGSPDPEVVKRARARWGVVRDGRDPQRELVIRQMRSQLASAEGDPVAGAKVFERVCGQCHKIYGNGQEVGPEITLNGRGSYDQLLSNVFDPSLVIGEAYLATTVATTDGRVLTGLVVENSPIRVVLKTQGGKQEVIARADVEAVKPSALSLMPEDLEKQLQPQELADLFAYITLDRPPTDPSARPIPGAEGLRRRPRGK